MPFLLLKRRLSAVRCHQLFDICNVELLIEEFLIPSVQHKTYL